MVHRYTHVVEEMYDRRKKGPLDQTFSRLSLIPSFRTGGRRLFALVADDRARSRKKDDCFFFFLSSVNVDHCEFLRVFSLQDRYIYIYIYIYMAYCTFALIRKNLCDEHVLIRRSFSKWSINPKSCSAGNRVRRSKRAISRLMYLFYLWLTSDP